MAPRLSKRQQREQEELLSLAISKPSATDLHGSSGEEESVAPAQTGFAAASLISRLMGRDRDNEPSFSRQRTNRM